MKPFILIKTLIALSFFCLPSVASEKSFSGSYLAANSAMSSSNFSTALKYYKTVIDQDPTNLKNLNNALLSAVSLGDFKTAEKIASHYELIDGQSETTRLVLETVAISKNNFSMVLDAKIEDPQLNSLVKRLTRAWAFLGEGKMADAKTTFNEIAENPSFTSYARYHEALAVATAGDFEEAEKILSGKKYGTLNLNSRGMEAYAQILVQLEKKTAAKELINKILLNGVNPNLMALRERINTNKSINYDFVINARQGIAEVYLNVAVFLGKNAEPIQVLIYSRVAEHLRPNHAPTSLYLAEVLEQIEQYELAVKVYSSVKPTDPNYVLAEIGRAETLVSLNKVDESIEVLKSLSKSHGKYFIVHYSLGNVLKISAQNKEAIAAYTFAIDLASLTSQDNWKMYFYRGIIHETVKDFTSMENDLRMALQKSPDQPEVLNFLGYSLVEQKIKLDEALIMIQKAVLKKPESGYITDSLGWIYYRLQKYQQAVEPMERAIKLLPGDPIVNDHLGDVYWKVDRFIEAEFQWKRSLSFSPEEKEADRIRKKLKFGLDQVLKEEQGDITLETND